MQNNKILRANIKDLTPRKAWGIYVGFEEEIFISNSMCDRPPIRDIREMCMTFARGLPQDEEVLFTVDELKIIGVLLTEHLEGYIKRNGGIDNLRLYTEEELDKMFEEDREIILNALAEKYGVTREELSRALMKR